MVFIEIVRYIANERAVFLAGYIIFLWIRFKNSIPPDYARIWGVPEFLRGAGLREDTEEKNGRLVPPDFMRPFLFQQKGLDPLHKHHILDFIPIVFKHDVVSEEFF